MNVHFGVVKEYFPQKGFGFATHPLESNTRKDVFFHISNVQKSNKDIADKLSSYEPGDDIYFYYEAEKTPKGYQVKSILPTEGISKLVESNLDGLSVELIVIWGRIKPEPIWLRDVTQDLFGTNQLNKFIISKEEQKEREELRRKEKEKIEKKRQKELELQERQRKIRDEERQKELELREQQRKVRDEERQKEFELQEQQRKVKAEEQERQRKIEDEEFELLVAEIEPKGFTISAQVSNYIIKHRLGDKYKHISDILEMENNGSSWKFNGGFPPRIYAELCQKIGLGNKGTNSRVVGFTPFKDL